MPELPEVETIVKDLNKTILKKRIEDVWSDVKNIIKKPKQFEEFKKEIIGRSIEGVKRRGKNILILLSGEKTLLVHQKMTGHLLVGLWNQRNDNFETATEGPLNDSENKYIHLMFWLSGSLMLALSDLRKFAKVELWDSKELEQSKEMKDLGPEPLDRDFSFEKFKEILSSKKGKIKAVLMDQNTLVGIGNIYSDEILWEAKIHPFKKVSELSDEELKRIYFFIKDVLSKGIEQRGTSTSDYRDIEGEKGFFQNFIRVYRRSGEKCYRCGSIIQKIKLNNRFAHFCPKCQKL